MKISDIIQKLAAIANGEGEIEIKNTERSADDYLNPVQAGAEQDGAEDAVTGKFIPPLQAKLELLKKVTGVESEFDCDDELGKIKQLSGLKPVVFHIADEDNDIVG